MKINSADENEFVLNLVNQRAPSLKQVWIGPKWDSRVNRFLWYDHSVPVYTYWALQEPSGNAGEPCGNMWTGHTGKIIRASGYWNDLTCGVHPGLPCQWPGLQEASLANKPALSTIKAERCCVGNPGY